ARRTSSTKACPAPIASAFAIAVRRSSSSLDSTRIRHGPDASQNATASVSLYYRDTRLEHSNLAGG
ncbi:MAG TPA: hypothetical protein VKS44_09455, partial [Candidatus Acidoferrales bacterium]|nr:hypothetical protein [Candidatus Acidoferrales bacterium]